MVAECQGIFLCYTQNCTLLYIQMYIFRMIFILMLNINSFILSCHFPKMNTLWQREFCIHAFKSTCTGMYILHVQGCTSYMYKDVHPTCIGMYILHPTCTGMYILHVQACSSCMYRDVHPTCTGMYILHVHVHVVTCFCHFLSDIRRPSFSSCVSRCFTS